MEESYDPFNVFKYSQERVISLFKENIRNLPRASNSLYAPRNTQNKTQW